MRAALDMLGRRSQAHDDGVTRPAERWKRDGYVMLSMVEAQLSSAKRAACALP
ncbi:MAG: hypothetical protein ACXVAC_09180 [Vulcanimicrobiaceae bacterium]